MIHHRGALGLIAWAVASAGIVSPAEAIEKKALVYYALAFEQLEYRAGNKADVLAWDGDAFYGTDNIKFRIESEGEYDLDEDAFETLEFQGAFQVPISVFFDAKFGVRYDAPSGPDRGYAVFGLHGLAPQWIEVDADAFISEKGDVSARLDMTYELLITNRLILTPSLELSVAATDDRKIGIGSGLTTTELGARLSYDLIDRDVAPYIGVHWEQEYGKTRRLSRREGEDTSAVFFVAGVKLNF